MKYSVVIPTYNHCDDLLRPCIESIIKYTNMADIELIISANGCNDGTVEYVEFLQKQYPNIKLIWSDEALGYPKATNLGIKAATCQKIVLLNNDCQLLQQKTNDWLNILDRPFIDNPKCGISCVVKEYSKVMKRFFAVFFCVMIDKKVFDDIGYLNEEYGTGSGEDMEFCIHAQNAGYQIHEVFEKKALDEKYFTGQFPIYHYGEGTVHDKSLVPDWDSIFLRNAFKLAKKYNEDWNIMKKTNVKKIGVITPVYNDIEHIFNAINSVKSQTLGNVIHYIYDDGSTDGLDKAMEELADDPTIKYIRSNTNDGQSYGRNVCLNSAILEGCEYIAFLDSDDFWFPNHLENNLDYHHANPDVDVTYSKPQYCTSDGSIVVPHNIPDPDIFIGKQLYHNNFIWISTVFAKFDVFVSHSFDGNLNSVEDWDMWINLFESGHKFHKLDSTTARYLVRDSSQASKSREVMNLFNVKHKMLPQLKLHLACGHDYTEGYINVDLYAPEDAKCDVRFDVMSLPYPDNSVDEIKAFHIIEHFHFFEIDKVLKEWYRVLKPGGRLWLETPDFLETCRSFVEGSPVMPLEEWRVLLYGHFFAHPWVPGQTHKFLFTENQLRTNLAWAEFKTVNRLPPASGYVMNHTVHLFLNIEAIK
jgi:GT2 family glycosyltransferase/SAM-dependent methyltransferase